MRPEDWCDACENKLADVCLQAIMSKLSLSTQDSQAAENNDQNKGLLAGTFFGGFFGGLIIVLATLRFARPVAAASSSKDSELAPLYSFRECRECSDYK